MRYLLNLKIFALPILLTFSLLSSCSKSSLSVQTDYITYKNLASYYVNTPDPRLNCPVIGQRLIISWSVPKTYLSYEDLHLEITIRFRNREEVVEIFNLLRCRGTYVYSIFNQEYIEKRGILTYKIDLVGGGCVLEEWRHQIWTGLIEIKQEERREAEEDELDIDWEEDDVNNP